MELQEPDFVLNKSLVPTFLSEEDALTMFETGRSLRFLRTHHAGHPLVRSEVMSLANPPVLEWKFSWASIEDIESKAKQFEMNLKVAIKQFSMENNNQLETSSSSDSQDLKSYPTEFFGKTEQEMEAHVLASIVSLSQPLTDMVAADRLSNMLSACLSSMEEVADNDAIFAPPISLTPSLSFSPLIAAQARIVNGTSMQLFFKSHGLREHLSIQRRFHLLGDGVFSSRLSEALFDPELETAERQAGVARTGGLMGLRLGGRDTWPPASSELRLALMGVLTESYSSSSGERQVGGYLARKQELPGDLSFAVRDMTEEEIQKCIDPNSVEALDFLRLSYKPPPPLEVILTPICLYKYDQLFKLLLRVVRMLFVVSQLFRDSADRTSYRHGVDSTAQRFRIEAHHFITCISSYFFDVGVDATWKIFDRKLDQIEARLNTEENFAVLGQHESIDKLREYHEHVLDRIMFALLLRKRQQPVMKLLDEIFKLVLQFANHSRLRSLGLTRKIGEDDEVKDIYSRFRRKVEVFITVCRALGEQKGYGEKREGVVKGLGAVGLFDTAELTEENTIVQLLAKLELSNYYSKYSKG